MLKFGCLPADTNTMVTLREKENNQVEAVADDGTVVEAVETWNWTRPFEEFASAVSGLASRQEATAMHPDTLDGSQTIDDFLASQRDLHAKLRRDRLTDTSEAP
jgi:hypothetical protein